jgi:UDP-N-acetylmuramate dehydrogenase
MKLRNMIEKFLQNVSLKNYVTFKIGGVAKYFFVAKTNEELLEAISVAKERKIPFFILGNGSNLLVLDKGYKGLVIRNEITDISVEGNIIKASSGAMLPVIASEAKRKELGGLEWMAGIPGTLGGAVWDNAGALGYSIKDNVVGVEVLNLDDMSVEYYTKEKCDFGYRESIFKKHNNLIILSAEFSLENKSKEAIGKSMEEFIDKRKNTQPIDYPSAGSIFKNPESFSAGELIEKCGLKGKTVGDVKISERHANFIINLGNGKSKDVLKLISLIKKEVKKKFKIKLEEEIVVLK